ncbi:hypothetical protein FISHEDRAFT_61320 [Fistulina hepatica ATCC 64428]|uniref:Transcription elongation factor Eaf N-terminal domain-containing protein n=1 Tax=Fistulina hepatica ATCC 64428 TaxID=1128425 RepID=A0A0D7A437_9AGAR|nr:hypothetical protein FISHEDRAFT_61320 [Fistulina hepatica ATCC 64428]
MATAESISWLPVQGLHQVNIGSSLTRALKARNGMPAAKSKFPERDFYSFRYNFKPPSVDATKPGNLSITRSGDTSQATVTQPSQTGDTHMFIGSASPAKEVDCILIYDEETQTFMLEKLDSYMSLKYEKKISAQADDVLPAMPQEALKEEEEEASEEEGEISMEPTGLPQRPPSPRPVSAPPARPAHLPRKPPPHDLPAKPVPQQSAPQPLKQGIKRPRSPSPPPPTGPATMDLSEPEEETLEFGHPAKRMKTPPLSPSLAAAADEETLEFGRPTKPSASRSPEHSRPPQPRANPNEETLEFGRPAKRSRPEPSAQVLSGDSLALSGAGDDGFSLALPDAGPVAATSDSEEEDEEWDEVIAQPDASAQGDILVDVSATDEGGEELDMGMFEMEMNQQLTASDDQQMDEGDMDDFANAVEDFAAENAEQNYDDDSTSSEDSDDD